MLVEWHLFWTIIWETGVHVTFTVCTLDFLFIDYANTVFSGIYKMLAVVGPSLIRFRQQNMVRFRKDPGLGLTNK